MTTYYSDYEFFNLAHDSFGTFSAKSTQKHLRELELAIDQVHLWICFHPAQTVIPLKTYFYFHDMMFDFTLSSVRISQSIVIRHLEVMYG